jgi:hypothetical protein
MCLSKSRAKKAKLKTLHLGAIHSLTARHPLLEEEVWGVPKIAFHFTQVNKKREWWRPGTRSPTVEMPGCKLSADDPAELTDFLL